MTDHFSRQFFDESRKLTAKRPEPPPTTSRTMISLRQSGSMLTSLARQHGRLLTATTSTSVGGPNIIPMATALHYEVHDQPQQHSKPQLQIRGLKTVSRRRIAAMAAKKQSAPSLETAMALPTQPRQMDNATLVTLGELGNHHARIEILKRHIMCRDKVSYERACEIFQTIDTKNKEHLYLLSLPYHIGIALGVSSAAIAWPMVFDLPTAALFNLHFVTTDVPEPRDLETMWEVGSWTWNWMEPALGTVSFVLLALQFSRAQIQNLGIKPYTARVKHWRGERLAHAFPQYAAEILINFSRSSTFQRAP